MAYSCYTYYQHSSISFYFVLYRPIAELSNRAFPLHGSEACYAKQLISCLLVSKFGKWVAGFCSSFGSFFTSFIYWFCLAKLEDNNIYYNTKFCFQLTCFRRIFFNFLATHMRVAGIHINTKSQVSSQISPVSFYEILQWCLCFVHGQFANSESA